MPNPYTAPFDAIIAAEGTAKRRNPYDEVLAYGEYGYPSKPVSQLTLGEAIQAGENIRHHPENPFNSSAIGAFQTTATNLRRARDEWGFPANAPFNEATQKAIAQKVYDEQGLGAWEGFKRNPSTQSGASQMPVNPSNYNWLTAPAPPPLTGNRSAGNTMPPQRGIGPRIGNFFRSGDALRLGAGLLAGDTFPEGLGMGFQNVANARDKRGQTGKPTSAMQEYQLAKQQGFQGSFLDYQTALKAAGKTSINNINAPLGAVEGEKFYEELDKGSAQMFGTLLTDGVTAESALLKINQLGKLLENIPTGVEASMKQIAGNYGINTEGLDDIQAAQAIINQLVPAQRPPGSGPMSDADLELFKQSMPRLINQPGGNKQIVDTMRGIIEYQIAQGRTAAAVANREITPSEGRRQLGSLPNPLQEFKSGNAGTGVGADSSKFPMWGGQRVDPAKIPDDFQPNNPIRERVWEFYIQNWAKGNL